MHVFEGQLSRLIHENAISNYSYTLLVYLVAYEISCTH